MTKEAAQNGNVVVTDFYVSQDEDVVFQLLQDLHRWSGIEPAILTARQKKGYHVKPQ
jgi:hypothetical protein